MKTFLISLIAVGAAAIGWLSLEHRRAIDIGSFTTGTVPRVAAQQYPGPSDGIVRGDRFPGQLATPVDMQSAVGPASLVIAQADTSVRPPQTDPRQQALPTTLAQINPAAAQSTASGQAGQTPPPVVDESALRYFASRGDTARLQAEISRLRALYPTWTPPADPLAAKPSNDAQLEGMWQLYAQSRFADVRQAIAQRQAAEPQWQPPADLLDRLKLAEARIGLTRASDRKDYGEVIRSAAENPSLLTCSEVDVLWRVAEAFARTDRQDRARDAYSYVLDNCDSAPERVATVQKASELLPLAMIDDLLSKERTLPGGQPEFDALRDDLARRFVADANGAPKDGEIAANGGSVKKDAVSKPVPERYVTRLEQVAEKQGLASDALLLGWYQYGQKNLGGAERWFRRAFTKEENASAAEGLALTLTQQKSPAEAENVLYKWRETSDDTRAAYLAAVANLLAIDPPPVIQQDVLARMAPVVIAGRDAAAAQQFGWYARAMRQPRTAAEWFAAALSWKPDDEPSAYGLALSRNDLNDRNGLVALQQTWAGRSERIVQVGRPAPMQPQAGQFVQGQPYPAQAYQGQAYQAQAGQPPMPSARPQANTGIRVAQTQSRAQPVARRAQAPAAPQRGCALTTELQSGSPEQSLSRGWCLMDLNRPLEAVKAFEAAGASASDTVRSDAAYGRSLAYLRVGLPDKAAAAAAAAKQNNTRAVELQSAILADRAVDASKAGRYREALIALDQRAQIVPEQTDLMVLRGYAYQSLGRRGEAQRIFQALADTGNVDAQKALADLVSPSRN